MLSTGKTLSKYIYISEHCRTFIRSTIDLSNLKPRKLNTTVDSDANQTKQLVIQYG